MLFPVIHPGSGERLRTWPGLEPEELAARLASAEAALPPWRRRPLAERLAVLQRAAALLRRDRDRLARLLVEEMGKPWTQALAEVDKCAAACDHFVAEAPRALAPVPLASDAAQSYVRFEALGAILAVMPWNFPYWQLFRFAGPALAAGNVVLLKPAPNVPGCGLALEALLLESGAPPGVFQTLLVDVEVVPELIAHPLVAAVTLTGSERAGAAVATTAGRHLKKTILELGGSDPFVVLADADLEATIAAAAGARCLNSGQSCIAAKRFLVEAAIADEFEAGFAQAMAALRVGDPFDPATEVGPLARLDLLENLDRQVQASVAAGARLATGGHRLDRPGFFYAPTVLTGVEPGMAAFDEETFGPVAAVTRVRDLDHAIELANRSPYGLGASLWTANPGRVEARLADLEAGMVFVNGIVKSDPRLPFGGVKRSGHGRELGPLGWHELVNARTVWVG